MFSEILVLSLISTNVFVLSQSPDVDIEPTQDISGDSPPTIDYDALNDRPFGEQTTAIWDDQHIQYWDPNEQPLDDNFTVDFTNTDLMTDYSGAQQSNSNGSSTFFWFFVAVIIICFIGIGIFWAFIVFDLSKERRKVSDGREQNKSYKDQKFDLKNSESAANQTVNSPKSADNLKNGRNSGQTNALNTNTKVLSKETVTKESKPKLTSKIEPSKKTLSSV